MTQHKKLIIPTIQIKKTKAGKHWEDIIISRDGKKTCSRIYIMEKGESVVIKGRAVRFLTERFEKGWDVAFNTNHYHVVRFITEDGVVGYPINPSTCWTANDLLKKGKVKTIEVFPVSQKVYKELVRAWREYEIEQS